MLINAPELMVPISDGEEIALKKPALETLKNHRKLQGHERQKRVAEKW